MELMAAIKGLEALNRPCSVKLYSDSQYLVNAFNQRWIEGWIKKGWKRGKNEPVKNIDLWKTLLKVMEPHKVEFIWVKGHDGHEAVSYTHLFFRITGRSYGKKFVCFIGFDKMDHI